MKLVLGDNLEALKQLKNNSIDAVVTDPPYGLKFMGKRWDYDVPSKAFWQEVLRVLKPGAHVLSFGGTRTYHRMVCNIEDAGFEIRDQIQWLYGSGFPKSLNLKDEWQGFGTALKPANEPIVLARKPLEKGLTVAENVLKYGTGAINVDGSRIDVCKEDPNHRRATGENGNAESMFGVGNSKRPATLGQGRWPANVLFDEAAAEMLDAQSGNIRSRHGYIEQGQTGGGTGSSYKMTKCSIEKSKKVVDFSQNGYLGGASRFFYVAKASKRERNEGLEGMPTKESGIKNDSGRGFSESDPYKKVLNQNNHPTVKPIKLMEYLIKLITPPNGIVLDPFMGSGSTGVACKRLGFEFVGMEIDKDYFQIAKRRIDTKSEINRQLELV